jgi:tetratricopeptide (TPR) repeat protein
LKDAQEENDRREKERLECQRLEAAQRERESGNENDKAIGKWAEAIRLNPRDADAYWNRGNAYYANGNYDKACSDCAEAIRLNPKYSAKAFTYRR